MPLTPPASAGAALRPVIPEDGARTVVWLVDDSALQGEISRKSLARQHTVDLFSDAAPMLERLAAGERPDLLVLDWHMPDISGLEACRCVREVVDSAGLPIIILTATGHHDDLLAGLAAGANDFIKKPADEAELNARVASLVRTKRLHARLAATEAALRDEASFRERFLAILAHDLRQPLNVFAMGSEMLAASDTPQALRERVRAQFDRATGRMQRMIGELLDFSRSRPQGGGMPVAPHPADLAVVVRDVVDEVRLAHPTRRITVDAATPCPGTWDKDRLAQVVGNLLENAVAHSDAGSPIAVALTKMPDAVEIRVENRGEPIASEFLPALFDPFRRGAARPPRDRGLGLGLYIVDQIARAHGGSVAVRNDDGVTRFAVRLPLDEWATRQ